MEGFTLSYSQCGEDLILKTIFGKNKHNGFYVDVGCNNPIQKSNTFKLYLKGWRGINIDGNQNLIDKFRKIRRRDICLAELISDQKREIIFFQDDSNHELSSVDEKIGQALKRDSRKVIELKRTAKTLEEIFDTHLSGEKIDLLTVDVENHDLQVLKGNNFEKYRPRIICIEHGGGLEELIKSDINTFLQEKNYTVLAYSSPNAYFKDQQITNI